MQPGDVIAGKYQIDRILGQGGMGTVVAATNLLLGQRVALKFLLPEFLHNPAIVERFLREARASARLGGEHVCRVYDVGNEHGAPFIVMELLDGRDLSSMVTPGAPLRVAVAVDYVLQACLGLAEAHALGIVHRDLKPANLFLATRLDGTSLIKVLDFGIAKAPSDTQFHLTQTAAVMGSPGYMSPEQLRSSRAADARSDIWALGVVLYELTCGRPPFAAESITELTLRVAVDPMPALPGVPRDFERVVARCLEKDPNRRYGDVAQLALALAPFGSARANEAAAGISNLLRRSAPMAVAPVRRSDTATTTLGSSASAMASSSSRRSRISWVVAAGVVVGVVGAVGLSRRDPEAQRTVPASQVSAEPPPAVSAAPAAVSPAPLAVSPAALSLDAGVAVVAPDAAATVPASAAMAAPPPVKPDPVVSAPSVAPPPPPAAAVKQAPPPPLAAVVKQAAPPADAAKQARRPPSASRAASPRPRRFQRRSPRPSMSARAANDAMTRIERVIARRSAACYQAYMHVVARRFSGPRTQLGSGAGR